MVIHRDAWTVGSLASSDPNAQPFHSPNWRHPGKKRSSLHELIAVEDDAVTISSHPPHDLRTTSANINLFNAISFSQTQDGFLKKVQESLQRMNELSVLAQNGSRTEAERLHDAAEFAQLQNRIKEIEDKMFAAINFFKTVRTENGAYAPGAGSEDAEAASSLRCLPLNEYLDETSNPERTTIANAKSATAAVNMIHDALEAVAGLRAKVGVDIQRLNSTGEQLCRMDDTQSQANAQIRDVNVAEESTRFARYDILTESGIAMLAQANALPQSALLLLG